MTLLALATPVLGLVLMLTLQWMEAWLVEGQTEDLRGRLADRAVAARWGGTRRAVNRDVEPVFLACDSRDAGRVIRWPTQVRIRPRAEAGKAHRCPRVTSMTPDFTRREAARGLRVVAGHRRRRRLRARLLSPRRGPR